MQLNETIVSKPRINEAEQKNLPDGVLCRGDWLTCSIEKLNANKRVYGDDVWDKVMSDPEIQEKMKNRTFYGQAEHPQETQSDLQLTSHVVTDMWVEESVNEDGSPGKDVYSKVDVLDTPCGRIVNTLIQAGCMVGTSTRAEGDLEEAENDEWGQHQRVVAEAYALRANDFTADPSTYNTLPRNVQMALMNEAVKGAYVKEDRLPKQFVITILENVRVRGAKARIKEIKAAKECADNKCFACANCGKCQEQQEKVEETMTLEELVNNELIKIDMVVKCREGEIEKTGKISKIGESNVTIELEDGTEISTETMVLSGDHVEVIFPDNGGLLGPLEPDLGDGDGLEADLIGDPLADELGLEGDLDTENELGTEDELGNELDDELDSDEKEPGEEEEEFDEFGKPIKKKKKPFSWESKLNEMSFEDLFDHLLKKFGKCGPDRKESLQNLCRARLLNDKVTASKSIKEARKLKIAEASSNAERDLAIQMAEEAEEQIEALEKQRVLEIKILKSRISESKDGAEKAPESEKDKLIEDLCTILENKTSQLVELKTTVKEVKKAHEDEITELNENYKTEISAKISDVENKNQKKLIDSYIDLKLGQTGLTVHRNARALLGKCTSTDEVDSIFNQIKEAMKRDALRPGTIDEIRVHKQDSSQSQQDHQVKESVDNACKGMSY